MCRLHVYPTKSLKIHQLSGPASSLGPPTRLCTGPHGGIKAAPTWTPCLILAPPFTSNSGSYPGTKYFKEKLVFLWEWAVESYFLWHIYMTDDDNISKLGF